MLTRNSSTRRGKAGTARFAVVASEFNRRYVDGMLRRALLELRRAGARSVTVVRVPGAFEVPVVAARLVQPRPDRPDAVICLGVIFRGETTHAQHVGDAVSLA
jgi:6,7-dimethyl-8-ribityllumazine synthase